jgi:hypothetical protein
LGSVSKLLIFIIIGLLGVSFCLVLLNQVDAMLALCSTFILLFPLFLISIKTESKSLITICLITFLTQLITVPSFFIFKEDFRWGHVKPFGFNFTDIMPILFKVELFIGFILFFYILLKIIFRRKGREVNYKNNIIQSVKNDTRNKINDSKGGHFRYGVVIFALILILIPLHVFMFTSGISIVGVESPNLPYKLSGILHYLTRYIIPLWLGYLYWKSSQSVSLAYLLLFYAFISGISSVSRSALINIMMPILALAWIQRRKMLVFTIGFCTLFGYSVVTRAREFVQFVSGEKTVAITDMGLLNLFGRVFENEMMVDIIVKIISDSFVGIFERIEGFSNLVMAQWYDPNQVVGSFVFVLRLINRNLGSWDQDLHHLQWQGNILPEGFVNTGSLLSTAVILGNDALYWIVFASSVSSLTFFLLDISTMKFVRKYGLPEGLGNAIIIFLCITYFIESGGSDIFFYPFIILMCLGFFPKIVLKKSINYSCLK